MGDQRQHRGPHPQDRQLFAAEQWPRLRHAAADLNWLLSRGYVVPSALKLVGDRYRLDSRQRLAVNRCSCGDQQLVRRLRHQVGSADLHGCPLWIDGYNVLTSIEAAMSGGVVLVGRDGCYRDMASMHGSYRRVSETVPAIELLGRALATWRIASCVWYLDQPVSNSGRLRKLLLEQAARHAWSWQVELVPDPDPVLAASPQIVASSDSQILDQAPAWFNLARHVIATDVPQSWLVDMSDVTG